MKGYKEHSCTTEILEVILQYIFYVGRNIYSNGKPWNYKLSSASQKEQGKIFSYLLQRRDDPDNDWTAAYQGPCEEWGRKHLLCE